MTSRRGSIRVRALASALILGLLIAGSVYAHADEAPDIQPLDLVIEVEGCDEPDEDPDWSPDFLSGYVVLALNEVMVSDTIETNFEDGVEGCGGDSIPPTGDVNVEWIEDGEPFDEPEDLTFRCATESPSDPPPCDAAKDLEISVAFEIPPGTNAGTYTAKFRVTWTP